MLTITDTARAHILAAMQASRLSGYAARLKIVGRGLDGFKYDFRAVAPSDRSQDDFVLETPDFSIYLDPFTVAHIAGTVIDVKDGRLKIENPNPVWTSDLQKEVAEVIEKTINPGVGTHGGQITLVDVQDDTAYIVMQGGCQGCGMARITLKQGVDRLIREAVPAIREVIDTTEHASGEAPYFPPGVAGESPLG